MDEYTRLILVGCGLLIVGAIILAYMQYSGLGAKEWRRKHPVGSFFTWYLVLNLSYSLISIVIYIFLICTKNNNITANSIIGYSNLGIIILEIFLIYCVRQNNVNAHEKKIKEEHKKKREEEKKDKEKEKQKELEKKAAAYDRSINKDPVTDLKKYKEMLDEGLISNSEYKTLKDKLLPSEIIDESNNCYDSADASFEHCKVGDLVDFGIYPQFNNDGNFPETPIQWIVTEISGNGSRVLITALNGINFIRFCNTRRKCSWIDSDIRKWLNNDFFVGAFSKKEKNIIASINCKCHNDINKENAEDKIFLPCEEILRKQLDLTTIKCKPTDFAKAQFKKVNYKEFTPKHCSYWIKKTYNDNVYCAINKNGKIITPSVDNNNVAVRPSLWVNI